MQLHFHLKLHLIHCTYFLHFWVFDVTKLIVKLKIDQKKKKKTENTLLDQINLFCLEKDFSF
jgi:hypothetical protein